MPSNEDPPRPPRLRFTRRFEAKLRYQSCGQPSQMGRDGARKTVECVTTFEHGHEPSARVLARDRKHDVGEIREILVREREPAQRIPGT